MSPALDPSPTIDSTLDSTLESPIQPPIASPDAATGARTRAEINRENAQHSTGPKTEEGKARVRMNAVSHGLFSKTVVLPGEDLDAFHRLGEGLAQHWNPLTEAERNLVRTVQETQWRISRAVQLEFALFALTIEQQRPAIEERFDAEPGVITALARAAAFQANARQFDQLSRLEARLHRHNEKAVRELDALIRNRPAQTPPQPAPENEQAPAAAPSAPAAAAPSGFVSPHPHGAQYPVEMPVFTGSLAKEKRRSWLRTNGYAHLAKRR